MRQRLAKDSMAPEFVAVTLGGSQIRLSELRGERVWLSFFRYASCPLCNHYLFGIWEFLSKHPHLEITHISVFESDPAHFPKYIGGKRWDSHLMVPDPKRKLYQLYGLEASGWAVLSFRVLFNWIWALLKGFKQGTVDGDVRQIPAHFLIESSGKIHTAYYGKNISDNIPLERVQRFVKQEGNQ